MCSDSEKNMSAFADQNHAPSLTCVQLELFQSLVDYLQNMFQLTSRNLSRCRNLPNSAKSDAGSEDFSGHTTDYSSYW
jgi:hypothetical protein